MSKQPYLIPNSVLRQILLALSITALAIVIIYHLRNFVPALLGAYTLYFLLRKAMVYLTVIKKWRPAPAALLLMLCSALIVVVPINALYHILVSRILPFLKEANQLTLYIEKFINDLEQKYNIEIMTQENLKTLGDWIFKEGTNLLTATVNSLALIAIMYFVLYFMMTSSNRLEARLLSVLPLNEKSKAYLGQHLNSLTWSNAVGVPVVGLFQSMVAWFGYWIAGVNEPFLWFIVTFIVSFIPILGAMLVYIPLSIALLYQGSEGWAVFLFLYGFLVVGSVDNVFRFWLQKKIGDTHPLITMFGVIIGLKLFGFLGLIFGPILISITIVLYNLYNQEYGDGAIT